MKRKLSTAILLTLLFTIQSATAFAQTTEFTYQGSLNNSEVPATGNYDFEFALFTSAAAGTQLGSTITVSNVAVANGIFSANIDFGNQFSGSARFLEIRVRRIRRWSIYDPYAEAIGKQRSVLGQEFDGRYGINRNKLNKCRYGYNSHKCDSTWRRRGKPVCIDRRRKAG